jgi:hypothetical protein
MGYEKLQVNGRWTGLYELRPNVYRSAGTFDTRDRAEDAWREVERDLRTGNSGVSSRRPVLSGGASSRSLLGLGESAPSGSHGDAPRARRGAGSIRSADSGHACEGGEDVVARFRAGVEIALAGMRAPERGNEGRPIAE